MLDHIPHRFFIPLFWLVYLLWMVAVSFLCWFVGGCPDYWLALRESVNFFDLMAVTMALWITIEIANRLKDWWLEEIEQ